MFNIHRGYLISFLLLSVIIMNHGRSMGQQVFTYKNIETKQVHSVDRHIFALGLGSGIEYGGLLGAQIEYLPISRVGLYVSGGYYAVNMGWELGLKGYLIPAITTKGFRPYVQFSYGTNGAILVDGYDEYNKTYSGLTTGAGLDMRFGKSKTKGMNLAVLYPFHNSDYKSDLRYLVNSPFVDIQEPLPIAISVGFRMEF